MKDHKFESKISKYGEPDNYCVCDICGAHPEEHEPKKPESNVHPVFEKIIDDHFFDKEKEQERRQNAGDDYYKYAGHGTWNFFR